MAKVEIGKAPPRLPVMSMSSSSGSIFANGAPRPTTTTTTVDSTQFFDVHSSPTPSDKKNLKNGNTPSVSITRYRLHSGSPPIG